VARIFISYRREDASGHAGRLYDQLADHFGPEQLFIDVDALEPGVDFVERIELAVGSADALVAVIGPRWLEVADAEGRRRLDDPNDFVGLEIATALDRGIRVVPVLVAGAVMPAERDLPVPLKALSRRNALVVSDLDWRSGVRRLVAALDATLEHRHEDEKARGGLLVLAGVLGVGLLAAGTLLRRQSFLDPDFGPQGTVAALAAVTSPAPLAVAAGAAAALGLLQARPRSALAAGLLLGVSLGGLAKYGGLLGALAATEQREAWIARNGAPGSILLAFAGAAVLAVVAGARVRDEPAAPRGGPGQPPPTPPAVRLLALVGAALTVAGTLIPFNVVFPGTARATERVVIGLPPSPWEAVEPLALAGIAIVTVLFASPARRLAVAGVLAALGALGMLLWLRYVGVPVLQMALADGIASVRPGGIVGLAGAALVLASGMVATRVPVSRSVGTPSTHPA
jgi:hypothetical protein